MHTINLAIRKIANGYVVTGHIEKAGGYHVFAEEYYPNLDALDAAISQRLANAEAKAAEIEPEEENTLYRSILWGRG